MNDEIKEELELKFPNIIFYEKECDQCLNN
jgi:hypothetical protein